MSVKYGTGSSRPHKSPAKPAAKHQKQNPNKLNKKLRPLSFSPWSGKLKILYANGMQEKEIHSDFSHLWTEVVFANLSIHPTITYCATKISR
jgi:hypothetical protein